MMPSASDLFEQRAFSPRLGRRIVACAGLSILLHAALVAWVRLHPAEFDFADSRRLFTFEASIKHEAPRVEAPSAPRPRANPGAAKTPLLRPSASVKPDAPAIIAAPAQDAAHAVPDASALPRIDLEQAKGLALEYDRQQRRHADWHYDANADTTAALETETAAARAIAKAAKPDCRQAYGADWGLFAIAFLIRDAATNSGCTWK
jgi:hypothetical protein